MINPKNVTDAQYQLLAVRRQNYDSMLWQTPVISLTAQAFLFTIALSNGDKPARFIASLLAFITALASAQLLAKHRYFEIYYSKLLESVERERQLEARARAATQRSKSYRVVVVFTLDISFMGFWRSGGCNRPSGGI